MNYQPGEVVKLRAGEAHGGWCVARPDDGPVVFVRHALPGETVLARVTEATSRLARAEAFPMTHHVECVATLFRRPAASA